MTHDRASGADFALSPGVVPLFAHHARLWRHIWMAIQAVAGALGMIVVAADAGGIGPALRAPTALRLVLLLVLLVVYHAVGARGYDWLLARRWAVMLFVPTGWALVLLTLGVNGAFGLLVLGTIVQGFIFLPFSWAMAILALATASLAAMVGVSGRGASATLTGVGGVAATGVMIGTVLLYIHRANRDGLIRTRLLHRLDEAQRDLADRAREAGVRDERQRFARDIHDTLAQGFVSVIKHLEAIEISLAKSAYPAERERVLPHLTNAKVASHASLAEIRRLVLALRPIALDDAPLAEALARVATHWGEVNAVPTTFAADSVPALQPDADVIFLRATQEALSNVARHAAASRVSVSFGCIDGVVLLTVDDDGRGFDYSDAVDDDKHGLSGMRERVRKCGGHLILDSAIGKGTSVTVAIPLSSIAAVHPTGRMPG